MRNERRIANVLTMSIIASSGNVSRRQDAELALMNALGIAMA